MEGSSAALHTRVPEEVMAAVREAAALNYEAPAAWVRRVVIERLRADRLLGPVACTDSRACRDRGCPDCERSYGPRTGEGE